MSENPYAPPKARVADVSIADPTVRPVPTNWIWRPPVLVWIVSTFATVQLLGVLLSMKDARYLDAINDGLVSPAHALAGFAHPLLLFLGGVLLLFLRRAAILMFGAHLVWGTVHLLAEGGTWTVYLELAIEAGICVYCWHLIMRGTLK